MNAYERMLEVMRKQGKKDNINYKSINVKQFFKDENNKKIELNNIKTYIKLRKKIEEALKGEEVLLYIDYNNHYSFLDEQIKEIAKIQKVRLSIILCEPFSIENAKKINYIKEMVLEFKKSRNRSKMIFLFSRYLLNSIIVLAITIGLQVLLNTLIISIIKFLVR